MSHRIGVVRKSHADPGGLALGCTCLNSLNRPLASPRTAEGHLGTARALRIVIAAAG